MIGKNWLYYLIDANGLSYYVENGVVKTSNVPKPLTYTPDGWQEILIGWERNAKYYGINRNFTGKLSFVNDGAIILRYLYFSTNIENKVFLLIQKRQLDLTATEFSYTYQYYYKGEIDLSSYIQADINEGFKVSVNIMEGGFTKLLKAYEGVTYEIPCNKNVPEAIPVWMDGIEFYNKLHFILPDLFSSTSDQLFVRTYAFPITFISEDGDSFGVYYTSGQFESVGKSDGAVDDYVATSPNYFFTTVKPVSIRITGRVSYEYLDPLPGEHLSHFIHTSAGQRIYILEDFTFSALNELSTSVDFDVTINLAANEKMFMFVFGGGSSGDAYTRVAIHSEDFTFQFNTTIDPSVCYCLRPLDLFNKIVKNMTGNQYAGISNLLTDRKNIVHTCGDAIRGFDTAVIKTSLNDFFTTRTVVDAGGLSYNDVNKTVEFELRKKYFDSNVTIDLGLIKDLKISTAKDFIFNLLKIGYPEQDYDTVNGKNEFNNTFQFTDVITRIVKTLDMTVPYRSDGYGIETIRKDYFKKDTTDSDSDNDVFVLNVEDEPREDGYYHLRRPAYTSVTGLISPDTVFNIDQLTPKRLLFTNGDYLKSCLKGFEQSYLTFQTTEKNAALETVEGSVTVKENANVLIGDLASPYFAPVLFEITTKVPIDLTTLLEENPNRCFQFTYNGNVYKGFNVKCAIAPNDNNQQVFTLLSTADNDLTKLIAG